MVRKCTKARASGGEDPSESLTTTPCRPIWSQICRQTHRLWPPP